MSEFKISAEQLGYWFFRLNGCLVLENFLIHHERKGNEGTDVDILGVRFPHRCELAYSGKPIEDYHVFENIEQIQLIIAEIKTGQCNLNGPWTDPDKRNMNRVLQALGAFSKEEIDQVSDDLYSQASFKNDKFSCRLFALGRYLNENLHSSLVQLTWNEILSFIYLRFTKYQNYKTQHRQWNKIGQDLFLWAIKNPDEKSFISTVKVGSFEEGL